MKTNIKHIKKSRRYTEAFKKSLVSDFESGGYSVVQLGQLHGVNKQSIYNWIYKYSAYNEEGYRVVEMKESSSNKVKALEKKIAELERKVGQKQIKIDYLEKMMDIAKDELNIDIKKNFVTPPSTGSDKTGKK
ncbi:MAG: hypothetical protein Roseis3KO_47200 [Roseivirga sp.]